MADKSIEGITFGTLLAFLAPGFVGFVGLSYHLPTARAWLDAAQKSEQSVGVFLFCALLSIVTGVIVSGLRALVADEFFYSGCYGIVARIERPLRMRQLRDATTLAAFQQAIENYYRYYQFYSNMAFALAFVAVSRLLAVSPPPWPKYWLVVIVAVVVLLLMSAYGSLRSFGRASTDILQPDSGEAYE